MRWLRQFWEYIRGAHESVPRTPPMPPPVSAQPAHLHRTLPPVPHDPPHVLRLSQEWPPGIDAELAMAVAVAGISFQPALTHARAFMAGRGQTITLERDPSNRHDRHAIKVIGHWLDRQGHAHQERLGWVPSEIAADIAREYPEGPLGARITTLFHERPGMSPGIRMHIGYATETWQAHHSRIEQHPKTDNRRTSRSAKQRSLASVQEEIQGLKRIGNLEKAERLLVQYIAVMESDVQTNQSIPRPWFYEQLAMIYRKRKQYHLECSILEQYAQQSQLSGTMPQPLVERLQKAKGLLGLVRK